MEEELYLVKDTETTGFAKSGLICEGQARVIQLGLILMNSAGKRLAQYCSLILPTSWNEITEGAYKAHGITKQDCEKYGVHINSAMSIYFLMAKKASVFVAHNANFDKRMLDIETAYFNEGRAEPVCIVKPWECTMNPNAHLNGGKSLANCLMHYTGRVIGDKAHDALHDAQACADIFFAMRQKKAA